MALAILIQAWLGSTRLPRKVCAELGGTTLVQQVYRRACRILPGTTSAVIVPWGEKKEIWSDGPVLEGPDEPLARFAHVVREHPAWKWVVRLTSDCPLLDLGVCREVLMLRPPAWTRVELDGLDTEIVSASMLLDADRQARDFYDREHVTPWLRRQGGTLYSMPHILRWSVNTQEDLEFVRAVYAVCSHCATAVPHHTNARTSIGGSNRRLVIDLHQLSDGGLVECLAADLLSTRMES